MLVQIERTRTVCRPSASELAEARGHWRRHHWVKLRGFLEPGLLAWIQRRLAAARFVERRHTGVVPPSVDLHMEPNAISAVLELVANDRPLFGAVEAITGCAGIVRFSGSVYRLAPGLAHHHNWHDDVSGDRLVAMSVNLEPQPYSGGILQIRERRTERILEEVENTGPGDAILFRVDPALQHRATDVSDGVKTAFAGWFRSASPFLHRLRGLSESGG